MRRTKTRFAHPEHLPNEPKPVQRPREGKKGKQSELLSPPQAKLPARLPATRPTFRHAGERKANADQPHTLQKLTSTAEQIGRARRVPWSTRSSEKQIQRTAPDQASPSSLWAPRTEELPGAAACLSLLFRPPEPRLGAKESERETKTRPAEGRERGTGGEVVGSLRLWVRGTTVYLERERRGGTERVGTSSGTSCTGMNLSLPGGPSTRAVVGISLARVARSMHFTARARPRPAGKPGTCFSARTEVGATGGPKLGTGGGGHAVRHHLSPRACLFAWPIRPRGPRPLKAFRFCARLAGGMK